MDLLIKDKVAVVTGGAKGIGAGVAEALRRFVPGVAEAMDAEGARA